jgi:quinoprotein glucose dehydrogenase
MASHTEIMTAAGAFVRNGLFAIVLCALCSTTPLAQRGTAGAEWPRTVGDSGGTKYSPLTHIDANTVKALRIVWRWKSDNFGPRPDFNLEATPIMVRGVLYTSAGMRRSFVAIDGATGETLWVYRSPESDARRSGGGAAPSGRGVAYWNDGDMGRIFGVTRGYELVALDAKTGRPVPAFGKNGIVDLLEDFDQHVPPDTSMSWGGPPLLVGDVVVIGTGGSAHVAGFIRGYDARTGRRVWTFHTVPQAGEFGEKTWEKDSNARAGNTGMWSLMTADEELGYIYVPVESPSEDYYGGHCLGDNLFGHSLVCLNAKTGKRVWHYQIVRHGVWDYDLPAPPNLIDVTVNGTRIKAVAQVTKQGFVYTFNRVTGAPIWPIEDRPVPSVSDVPGERLSPTQPFPTKPAPFERQGLTVDDLIDFTPALRVEAAKIIADYRYGPLFTPPIIKGADGLKATISVPGGSGGANWEGAAFDPETQVLYVPSFTQPTPMALIPRSGDQAVGEPPFGGSWAWGPEGPQGLPLLKPPYSRITAIDMTTGEHVWMVPNGDTPAFVRDHPALKGVTLPKTGSGNRSGILVTKTLLFAGEGSGMMSAPNPKYGGSKFRAFDKRTGDTVWEFELPGRQSGNPMTFAINDRQFIVVPIGGPATPSELVALSVP